MSALLQTAHIRPTAGLFMEDGIDPPAFFQNGLPFAADGALALDFSGVVHHYHQGLPFTENGRLIAKTGPYDYFGMGAAPFLNDGTLSIEEVSADHYVNGVPYSATSAIAISLIKTARAIIVEPEGVSGNPAKVQYLAGYETGEIIRLVARLDGPGTTVPENWIIIAPAPLTATEVASQLAAQIDVLLRYTAWAEEATLCIEPAQPNHVLTILAAT